MLKSYYCLIFVIFLLLISPHHSAFANNKITLQDFLTTYFSKNEQPKNLKLDLKLAKTTRDKIDNHFSSILSISPEKKSQKDKALNPSWDREKSINAEFLQNLPTGTSVRVGATKWLENSTANPFSQLNKTVDSNYYLRLEQDLWRNGLGYNQQRQTRSAKAAYQGAQLNNSIELAKLCSQAIDIYLSTYKSQAIFDINREIFNNSKKILSSIKKSYRAKLIKKIEFLTAQSDHLNNEQRLKAAKREFDSQKISLSTSMNRTTASDLQLVKPQLGPSPKTSSTLSPLYHEALQQNVLAQKWNHQAKKNLKRPEVKIFAETAQVDNQFATPGLPQDATTNTVGININIPIHNKQLTADSKESYYQWQKAENEKNYQLRKLQNDLKNSLEQNSILKLQLDIVERQKVLQKKQTGEARKLLRSGQIEFRDYIQYRDFELQSEVNWVNLMQSYLNNQVLIATLSGPNNNYCQKGF